MYLVANIDGRRHLALIDSGCELSMAPSSVVGNRVLRSVTQGVVHPYSFKDKLKWRLYIYSSEP